MSSALQMASENGKVEAVRGRGARSEDERIVIVEDSVRFPSAAHRRIGAHRHHKPRQATKHHTPNGAGSPQPLGSAAATATALPSTADPPIKISNPTKIDSAVIDITPRRLVARHGLRYYTLRRIEVRSMDSWNPIAHPTEAIWLRRLKCCTSLAGHGVEYIEIRTSTRTSVAHRPRSPPSPRSKQLMIEKAPARTRRDTPICDPREPLCLLAACSVSRHPPNPPPSPRESPYVPGRLQRSGN
ncbi:hypothetical protein BZA05DRAFT_162081 [Tricharina praecox]|uniref:uncharacterized protein n=1 Tax=Tricharina praecox TaxID=43433 RepID=UPI00221F2201|nr:uncharacterized protein BZA05DRAFT_162081 [Tricharina praecox]KAI5856929.1 hypothetical protein BZA05DRAFT_162081 [Tricharina praecox]